MRARMKDEHYFIILSQKERKNIIMFEDAVKKTALEKGELDRGTRNGYSILINSYEKEINLLYSLGENLETIEECYKKLLFYYSKMWDKKYGYIELVKVLSLGVLFKVNRSDIFELEQRLISEKFDDYLVNTLIKEIDSTWEREGVEFEFEVYECLKQILDNDEIIACEALKEYLQEKWYEIHRECAWYDSHKSSKNVYYGYWSFEAGAIAKILNLDDSSLKDVPYYPYEFVPVSDNKCSIKICGTSPRMLELLAKFCRGGNTKQAFLDVKLFLRKLRRYLAKQIDITAGMNLYFFG